MPDTSQSPFGAQPSISEVRGIQAKVATARRTARTEELDNLPPNLPAVRALRDQLCVVQPLVLLSELLCLCRAVRFDPSCWQQESKQ